MKKYEVTAVKFHQGIFTHGRNIGDTLPSANRTFSDLKMETVDNVGIKISSIGWSVFVPFGNVAYCNLGREIDDSPVPAPVSPIKPAGSKQPSNSPTPPSAA